MQKFSIHRLAPPARAAFWTLFLGATVSVHAGPDTTGFTHPAAAATRTHSNAVMSRAEQENALYALGVLISHNLDEFDLSSADFNRVKAGLTDGFNHRAAGVDLARDGVQIQALRRERLARLQLKRQLSGNAFLDRAAALAGARRTASGLVYVPVREGTGASPGPDDNVVVNYEGRLIDGSLFDGSQEHGGPSTFSLRSVIPCWSEALALMKAGGTSRIVCPAALAYGTRGEPPKIGPDATLDFRVDLLEVQPAVRPGANARAVEGVP